MSTSPRVPRRWAAVAAIAILGITGLCWGDFVLRHGVEARWSAQPADEWIGVVRTIEHRPSFPNRHRALSRIAQNLDFETHGVPDGLFPFRARIVGSVTLERGGRLSASVAPSDSLTLRVDGEEVGDGVRLGAGTHAIDARWSGHLGRPTRLEWTLDGESIANTAWRPPPETFNPYRWALWILGVLGLVLFSALAWWASGASGAVGRRRWATAAFGVILLLGLGLRLTDYAVMPEMLENDDYLFATWNGWSLLEDGTSRGWSMWYQRYGDRVEHEAVPYFTTQGGGWRVVSPYFEHPPGMHLLVGLAAHLGGAEHFTHARLKHTRLVPIALAGVTLVLTFLIGRRLDPNPATAVLGCALWATIPWIVIQSRVIKEEALLTPMALLGYWAYLRWRDDESRLRWIVLAGFVLGGSCFAKVPGIMFLPPLILLLLADSNPRAAGWATLAGLAGASVLLVYAAAIDWDLFWYATSHQASGRPTHWNIFPRFFSAGLINFNHIGHPHLIFLWIAYAMGLMGARLGRRDVRPSPVLVVPPLVYLGAIGISSGNWTFGWYILPILPFLCLGAGRFLVDLWREPDALRGLLVIGLLVMYGLNFVTDPDWLKQPPAWRPMRVLTTLFFSLTFLPFLLTYLARGQRGRAWRSLARSTFVLLMLLHVGLSATFVRDYESIYETHQNFDRDEYFDR